MGACHISFDSFLGCLPKSMEQTHKIVPVSNNILPTLALASMRSQHYQRKDRSIRHATVRTRQLLLHDMSSDVGFLRMTNDKLALNMVSFAEKGQIQEAQMLWDECVNSSFVPSIQLVSSLMIAYAKTRHFDQITAILGQVRNRDFSWLPHAYSLAISCFGMGGDLERMEHTLCEMVSMGFQVDSNTANAYVIYYSAFGSLAEMEAAYGRLKKSRILLVEGGIRAMSYAYMREKKFYRLGEFLRGVGLGRRTVGNLMWNLLLLSYGVNFKMKSLQGEFLGMLEAGFRPDITTFNIRALAFSNMNLFWDLHLSLEHMRHENVVPDLVTYGCVVDAYLNKRMGRNLDFALNKMINLDERPSVETEPFVFEVMGKGEFHSSSEAFMEFNKHKDWTYRKLIGIYVKKRHRSNQIFWNY
ncbi:pentatricopeptide repeat-containing protein At3g42630 [Silene latifolia]|uniref:pentatricopeptide repeat-containing protein At3g42630 n=1 Tax=Silene latifolia TaxID=37657 RepID=UPI003D782101